MKYLLPSKVGERVGLRKYFICLHLLCLTLITGKDGHLRRRRLTLMWGNSPSKRRMLKRMPKTIWFSPPTWESLHTNNPHLIGARLLLHHRCLTMIIPMMTHQHGVTIRVIEPHLGQKPKIGGRYTDITLIYISCSVGSLYIHCFAFFLVLVAAF